MKKRPDKNIDEHPDDQEPPWMNPANQRNTPYTEEELEPFAEGFISRMSDIAEVKSMIARKGEEKVKEILIEGFRKQDERNLINIDIEGSVH